MKKITLYDFEVEYLKEGYRIEKQVGNNTYFVRIENGEYVAYRKLRTMSWDGETHDDREAMNPTKFKFEIK